MILTVSRFCISYGRTLRFRFAFAGAVNDKMLKLLIKEGRPSLTETECVKAALIAVKNPGLSGTDVRAAAKFRETFSRMLRQEGALILGIRHDTALACFGSPPERICSPQKVNPALRAVRCVNTLRNNPLSAEWHFGIEYGECVFFWSAETGYSADGHPVIRAGAEAALVKHFNVQAIIGESVKDIINAYAAKKLASLEGENVYELTV